MGRRTMIKLLMREKSLTLNLNSEKVRIKTLVKTKLRLLPKLKKPRLRLRPLLRRRLLRASFQRKRKNLPKLRRLLPMPPPKLMRDFHQNSPLLYPKETHGKTSPESEMHLSSRISFQIE